MDFFKSTNIPLEGEVRIPSGCAIASEFSTCGERFTGEDMIASIRTMHERSNGLGGGFAGYGIYPEYKDYYAFHIFYDDNSSRLETEHYLDEYFDIVNLSKIPTRKNKNISDEPLIWRYFLTPLKTRLNFSQLDEKEYTVRAVMHINTYIKGAYIFSSGKDMGIFKAVGYPEDVGEFYRLDEYEGYSWTVHGRYPTNTPGWWGGAHPFGLLETSVVHNGEISSYDANRRSIEMYGYKCTLQTDTEVITYIIDYLSRIQGLSMEEISHVIASPFWTTIGRMDDEKKKEYTYLRKTFSSFLITGPFSIIVAFPGGIMALNDRLKLRSLVAAVNKDRVYFASEEAAIRVIAPDLEKVWYPKGGEAVVVKLREEENAGY